MQLVISLLLTTTFLVCIVSAHSNSGGVQARRIADMMNRFGAVTYSSNSTNLNVWGTWPSDYTIPSVTAAVKFLVGDSGLQMNYREYFYSGTRVMQESWMPTIQMNTRGRFSVAIGAQGKSTEAPGLVELAASSASSTGYIEYIEGINEPNIFPVSKSEVLSAQAILSTGIHNLTNTRFPPKLALPSIAVTYSPISATQKNFYGTDLPTILNEATVANAHIYPQREPDISDGYNDNGQLADFHDSFAEVYGKKSQIITEWHPTLYASDPKQRLNSVYDCYFTPLFILRAFLLDYERFYWWALFDWAPGSAGQMLVGIFPQSGFNPPRQIARVIRAMYLLTRDTGSNQLTFNPGELAYTITGLPPPVGKSQYSGGQHLLFQNSTGEFFLYVWNAQEEPWGAENEVTVTFTNGAESHVTLYRISDSRSPTGPTTPLQEIPNCSSIKWGLDANVYLLVVTPSRK